jgi:hypothetical protein
MNKRAAQGGRGVPFTESHFSSKHSTLSHCEAGNSRCRYMNGDLTISLDGGDPIDLLGDIVLCSRDAIDDDRHYSGSLAHLSLFDAALLPSQVGNPGKY